MIFTWTDSLVVGVFSIIGLFFIFLCYDMAKCAWEGSKIAKEDMEYDKKRLDEIRYKRFTTGESSLTKSDLLFEHWIKTRF